MKRIFLLFIIFFQLSTILEAKTHSIGENTKAIYGTDDRHFVDIHTNSLISNLANSVAFIVSEDSLEIRSRTTLVTAKFLTSPNGLKVCPDENFAQHHSINSCTGFLIAPDLLASAGHCFMSADDCARKRIIFNMRVDSEVQRGYSVPNDSVYECSEIVKARFIPEKFQDYSLIRLKQKVVGRVPLKFRTQGRITKEDHVFMIGHPLGLPLIYTGSAIVNDIRNYRSFKATLDSFEGNSGSPVINSRTLEVEGILVRRENDFLENPMRKCYVDQVYDQGSSDVLKLKGEGVTRISEILPLEKAL